MTDKEKLIKIKSLADKMSDTAFNITTDASLLKKAIDEYHQFIINEYHKEEQIIKELELEEVAQLYAKQEYNRKNPSFLPQRCIGCYAPLMYAFKAGAQWKEKQMMKDAVDACVTDIRTYKEENEVDFTVMYEKGIIPYEIEQEVKLIIIKED